MAAALALCGGACGSSSGGGAADQDPYIEGAGAPIVTGISAGGAWINAVTFNSAGRLIVRITDYDGACALEDKSDAHHANSTYLEIDLGAAPGSTGTFPLTANGPTGDCPNCVGPALLVHRDQTCAATVLQATGGKVTISSLTHSEGVQGKADLEFAGNPVSAYFGAPICNRGEPVGSGGACVQ